MSNNADFTTASQFLTLHLCYVSVQQFAQIKRYFGSVQVALEQPQSAWQEAAILRESQCQELFSERLQSLLEQAVEWANQSDQHWLFYDSNDYPQSLKETSDPPLVLGVRGQLSLLKDPQLAIVGSRHASRQGLEVAKDFAHHLSAQGLTITSGLALGIDAAAHQGGLQGVGKTLAVVATGLDRIYPASNRNLGQQIVEQGAMVSEFPLGTKPLSYHFPRRNRIISGLSVGTLVVEAAIKSGSLITARTALEQGREVFAVPGSIYNPQAKGCHALLKQGAKLVESGQDILEELAANLQLNLDLDLAPAKAQTQSSPMGAQHSAAAQKLLQVMDYDPMGLDELAVLSKMPIYQIQAELVLLELSGAVEAMSAGRWRKIR